MPWPPLCARSITDEQPPRLGLLRLPQGTISVLQDYGTQHVIVSNGDHRTAELRDSLASLASPRFDDTPHRHNPHAGEARVCSILDNLDVIKARQTKAQQYMDWVIPAWEALTDEDRLVLETFFLDDLSAEDAAVKVTEHFYVERKTAFAKKSRALSRFARLLYGRD